MTRATDTTNSVDTVCNRFGVSKTMARKYIDKGITLGLWTQEQVGRWFSKGKHLRRLKKTDEPVRPSTEWLNEELGDDGVVDGNPISFEKAFD